VLMGVGRVLLVDHDKVSESNLNRQVLFMEKDIGKPKVAVAKERLEELNPETNIEVVQEKVYNDNIDNILRSYRIIVDCLDNWYSRKILDSYIWRKGKVLVHGAVNGFYGQVTTIKKGITTCLSCLFPEPGKKEFIPAIGPAVTLVASIQVMEVAKIITNIGTPLYNRIAVVDSLEPSISVIGVKPLDCGLCSS
ncbi:MAG: HesA/MoeB/ThiF family protein, partial [Desulfurococcales archaeon]|nr:HesA/MoeB/ThiF family protein [Desulfurococcales archaeon]